MNECYIATNNEGGEYYTDAARYPNHAIYSTTEDINDAYVVFFCPNLDASNSGGEASGFGGYSYGVVNIGDTSIRTKNLQASHDEFYQSVPNAYDLTSQGLSISVEPNNMRTSATTIEYQGNLIINAGYWDDDAQDFVYEQSLMDFEIWDWFTTPWYEQVAFAPDGMTGYIAILANDGETWSVSGQPNIYPIYWKTTDGGENWDGPHAIQIDGPDGIGGIVYHMLDDESLAAIYDNMGLPLPARDQVPYTYSGDFDMAVSSDGNLHIAGLVALAGTSDTEGGISYYPYGGSGGVLDVFTTDGGTTWYAEEMGRTQWVEGIVGAGPELTQNNRVQITAHLDTGNPLNDKFFVSWSDTDAEEEANTRPNIFCRGFQPSTYMKTSSGDDEFPDGPVNVTFFSPGHAQSYGATAAKSALELTDGTYTIPFVFEDLDINSSVAPVQFKYISDFSFSDVDFTIVGVEDNVEPNNSTYEVSQNFPNPFSGKSYVTVSLDEGSNLNMDVFTLTGQKVSSQNYGSLSSGSHTLTIDANNLPSGVYFYTITAGENKSTHKMIVE